MATYYSWTNFTVADPDTRKVVKRIRPGDKVIAKDLGLSKDEFEQYIENGAVRTYEHPDMGRFSGSPVELARAQLAAAATGGFFDTQYGRVGTDEAPEVDPETGGKLTAEEVAKLAAGDKDKK